MSAVDAVLEAAVELYEAASISAERRRIDALRVPRESQLAKRVGRLFVRQGNMVSRGIVSALTTLRESTADVIDSAFDEASFESSSDMQGLLEDAIQGIYVSSSKLLAASLELDIVFRLTDPRAIAYARAQAATAISQIDETTRADIRNLVLEALDKGTSYSDLGRQIKARYAEFAAPARQGYLRNRSELVAVTELGTAMQAGNRALAVHLRDGGLGMEKYWMNSGDRKVSAGCRRNTADGWIPLDDLHSSGHLNPLRFPGCRCAELYRRAS